MAFTVVAKAGCRTLAVLVLTASSAIAQGSIAGVVRDTTGAVMPGVTVEAASPALIEKVRTAATDSAGLYQIVDLRPGLYTITFSLDGFNAVRREGIEVTGSFTATVNIDLKVGSLEETITVSGQAPTVDVHNVVQSRVVGRDVIDAIPTGTRAFQQIGALVPGVTLNRPDVGGTSLRDLTITFHNSRAGEMMLQLDGMPYNHGGGMGGARNGITMNDGSVQEISLELGGLSAEISSGSVRSNVIPKEGGNAFKGFLSTAYSNHNFQSNNLTADLQALGLRAVDKLRKVWDVNPAFGGPIIKDRLWFQTSVRNWGVDNLAAGIYYNLTPTAFVYTPDYSRQGIDGTHLSSENVRLTWQASPRNKFNVYYDIQQGCYCEWYDVGRTSAPEAAIDQGRMPDYMAQATWSSPVTSRLLLEAGGTFVDFDWPTTPMPGTEDTVSLRELSTNQIWRAFTTTSTSIESAVPGHNASHNLNGRFSVAYVTGSQSLKVGTTFMHTSSDVRRGVYSNAMSWSLLNGQPRSITEWATPVNFKERLKANIGVYLQDQWTVNRLTLNMGVRFDYMNAYVPAQHEDAGPFVPARDFAKVSNVPNWKDVSPRLGVSYDVFHNGKTAIKGTLGRYLQAPEIITFTRQANPAFASVVRATRTWTDLNGNFSPDCDLTNPDAQPECGGLDNTKFGQVNILTRYDQDVINGFGKRGENWETSAGIQHELRSGLSVNGSYYRRWYGNFTVTDNLDVTPADYDAFCIPGPADPRLPGSGGSEICGLYDGTVATYGHVNNLITFADHFGRQREVYDAVDLNVNARLQNGIVLAGGTNTGRTVTDSCFVVDSPQALRFCHVAPPFLTQIKLYGVYPLPWLGLQASFSAQSVPGPQITATYVAANQLIKPSLNRDLAAGAQGTATVELIQPGTMFAGRMNQFDFRVSRVTRIGRMRIRPAFDIYNLFNSHAILALNTQYGSAWQTPTRILQARLIKFGAQFDF